MLSSLRETCYFHRPWKKEKKKKRMVGKRFTSGLRNSLTASGGHGEEEKALTLFHSLPHLNRKGRKGKLSHNTNLLLDIEKEVNPLQGVRGGGRERKSAFWHHRAWVLNPGLKKRVNSSQH